ncbi:MAG: hypothetical protein ACTHMC_17225, partial [Pseudobacter sp.]|uniref:hypothetical protein n=1 Tax=Pseudobacter sp. TaxID=2045420 RepID=UPI003F809CC3
MNISSTRSYPVQQSRKRISGKALKNCYSLMLLFLLLLAARYPSKAHIKPSPDGIVFVKKGSTGNGNSWSNALGELADALWLAKTNPAIRQIWVAGGTYKPMFPGGDDGDLSQPGFRSFVMVNNVKMFGGFAGTESTVNQRDLSLAANETILSGDIDDNDGTDGAINGSNALHLLIAAGTGIFHLDGFTIQGGKADINAGEITVNGVSVPGTRGAGLYAGYATVNVNACKVRGNASGAGTIAVDNSDAFFANTQVTGNLSGTASGILNSHSNIQLLNITFSGNSGNYVLYNLNSTARADNSVFYNNGGNPDNGSTVFNHCLLPRTPAGTNINADPDFVQPVPFATAPFTGGNYQLKPGSPAQNAGNNALIRSLGSEGIQLADMADNNNGSGCSAFACSVSGLENITDNNNTSNYCVLSITQGSANGPNNALATVGWTGQEVKAGEYVGFVIAQENIPIGNTSLLSRISILLRNDLGGPVHTQSGLTLQTTTLNGQPVYYVGIIAPVSAKYAIIRMD